MHAVVSSEVKLCLQYILIASICPSGINVRRIHHKMIDTDIRDPMVVIRISVNHKFSTFFYAEPERPYSAIRRGRVLLG